MPKFMLLFASFFPETEPICTATNLDKLPLKEGEIVSFKCKVRYAGRNGPRMKCMGRPGDGEQLNIADDFIDKVLYDGTVRGIETVINALVTVGRKNHKWVYR